MSKKMIYRIITLVLLSVCLPVLAETAGQVTEKQYRPAHGISNEKALEGYINRVFGITPEITPRNASLTGLNQEIYDALVPLIRQVAAGQQQFTTFTVQVSGTDGFDLDKVVDALLVNLPFDMYWYDKDELSGVSYNSSGLYSFFFPVAPDFSADGSAGSTEINTAIGESITTALNTAQNIIISNQNNSDPDKLTAYKNAICGLVSYNQAVADDDTMPYGNPWQMIWVFDGDPDTNVVCEGYSKAFKYLCDNSSFRSQNLSVSIVTGTMIDDTGEGPHMWNLVAMGDGKNYLADITNCDEGSVGYPDALFMAGSGRPYSDNGLSGYIFSADGTDIVYAYDGEMAGLYTEAELTVSETAYVPPAGPQIVADGVCGDDLTWTLDSTGTLTVSGTGEMYGGWNEEENPWAGHKAEILHAVVEQGVTSLGLAAFRNCEYMTDISLPDTLTYIGYQALGGCYRLTDVTIPDNVTFIGRWAFSGCPITSIIIPSAVTEIEFGAFSFCNQLEEIIIAPGNHSYLVDEDGVLFSADQTKLLWYPIPRTMTSYTVPDTVTTLDGNAFSVCVNLQEIILPAGLFTIGDSAFDRCQNLTDVYFQGDEDTWSSLNILDGNSSLTDARVHCVQASGSCGENLTWRLYQNGILTVSGTGAMADYETDTAVPWYRYRDEIVRAVIEPGVASVGAHAFHNCANMTGVSLPQGLTGIGPCAFQKCGSLTGELVIPSSVTSIGGASFQYCSGLTGNLIIPSSVTDIGDNAFQFCSGLTGLTLPSGLTSIGAWSFHQCTGLVSQLALPEGLTVISDGAFSGSSGLTGNLTIPSSVTAVGEYAFENCSGLTGLVIPSSVNSIGNYAFWQCTGLVSPLTLPEGLQTIGSGAFSGCSGLTGGLTIPSSVTSIEAFTFQNCSSLTGLTLPSGLTGIGDFAFQNCSGLTGNLIIPSSVTAIGEYTFQNCSGLVSALALPDGLTAIANGSFGGCSGLTGHLIIPSSVTAVGEYAFADCSGLTGLVIPSSVNSIGKCAFCNCTGLVAPLTLPEGLHTIGDLAFSHCSGLTGNLTFPSSMTVIGEYAFEYCSGLTGSLVLPSALTSVGEGAFARCTGFSGYLQVPGSVLSIADGAFYDCNGLTDIYYAGSWDDWYAVAPNPGPYNGAALHFGAAVSESGWFGTSNPFLWILDSRGHLLVRGSGDMESFRDDQDIPWYPYRQDILHLTVAPGVTGIGAHAFKQLTQLVSVFLPDGLEYIGGCAFDHCESLPEISLPESVATIEWYSFGSCYALTDIFIPRNLTTIGDAAFAYCLELSQITVDADNPAFTTEEGVLLTLDRTELVCYPPKKDKNTYSVPDTVTTIRTEAFSACETLCWIILPPRLESIGESAFSWCSQLSQIRIPAGVAAIPQKAFSYCSSLTAIHIPASVRNIGNQAFYRCDSLADVYYFGTEPEWNAVFIEDNNESLTNAVLHFIHPDLILPAQLTAIESEAFAGIPAGSCIFVPDTVAAIAPDAFDPGTVIVTPAGSYAAGWAAENGFACFEQ